MENYYYSYNEEGAIIAFGLAQFPEDYNQPDCQMAMTDHLVDPRVEYVVDGVLTVRPEFALGIDTMKTNVEYIVQVPDGIGIDVTVNGQYFYVQSDGLLELESQVPGEITIRFNKFPYKSFSKTIEVSDEDQV